MLKRNAIIFYFVLLYYFIIQSSYEGTCSLYFCFFVFFVFIHILVVSTSMLFFFTIKIYFYCNSCFVRVLCLCVCAPDGRLHMQEKFDGGSGKAADLVATFHSGFFFFDEYNMIGSD